ncbi:MAG: hypothetical protein AB9922_12330 [Bacteroidales bacterium]
MKQKQIYLNKAQQEALLVGANTEVDIWGRRTGKSHGIVSQRTVRNVQMMPGSTGAFVSATFKQAHTRTLPAMLLGLSDLGYKRDTHFVIGKRPPKKLGFKKPIVEPNNYDDVIAWYNGSIQVIISQDVKLSSNSMTLDYVIGDEAKGLNFDKLKEETFPANGGTRRYFGHCPWHHGYVFVSDMPVTKSGKWLLNYREKMDPEVIQAIKDLMGEWHRLQSLPDSEYKKRMIKETEKLIAQLRSIAVYYSECSTFENVDIVGLSYLKQMKRDLPPLVFQTSIMSKRIERLKDGFYPNFNEKIHTYISNNNKPLIDDLYIFEERDYGCRLDSDVDLKAPIAGAFDYNANINWLVVGQRDGLKLKVLKSFYVKYNRKLRELIDDFCHYYRYHQTKEFIYYYDNTALGSNYAVSNDDFAAVACDQLYKNGWKVTRMHMGNPMKHYEKYLIMDDCFKGAKHLFPVLNKENNEALIISISLAEVTIGSRGFQKCKAGEKLVESEDDPLEYRTDGSDAFDTLLLGNVLFPYSSTGIGIGSAL